MAQHESVGTGTQTATIDTEHTLDTETGGGTYFLQVDCNAMALGDELVLRVKTKTLTGSTSRLLHEVAYAHVQGEPNKIIGPIVAPHEIIFTLEQEAGTGRAYDFEVFRERVAVGAWRSTDVAAPTVEGVPEVDLTHLGGVVQSAIDLKDFADAGYDPATNKITGCVLTDTVTANTDMRGTDSAALASVLGALADAAATGDPTAVDTVMQYVKQLVNVLVGTAGIATMPTPLDPANGVNLFEMLRAAMGVTFAGPGDSLETIAAGIVDVQFQMGTGGAGLTDLGGMSTAMKAEVNLEVDAALIDAGLVLQVTTITGLVSQTVFNLTAGSADNEPYIGCLAVITDVATGTQKALGIISDYVGATKTVTLREDPGIFVMANTDNIAIVAVPKDVLDILADVTGIGGAAMRGTDSAALASVATEARLAELDAANLPADIAAIPTTAMRGTDSAALASVCTEARLAELDAANLPTDIAVIPTTAMRGTDNAALASEVTAARMSELDAATGGKMANQVDLIKTEADKIALADAGAGVAGSVIEEVENRATPAQVNTEVVDVIDTDTSAEPGQGAPPATASLRTKVDNLYKSWRNKKTNDGSTTKLFADDTTTVDAKQTTSEAGGTVTKDEWTTGP